MNPLLIYYLLLNIGLTVLFVNAEPIILLKRLLTFKEEKYDEEPKWKQFFHKLITCEMCSSFYIGLFFGIDIAIITPIFFFVLDKLSKQKR